MQAKSKVGFLELESSMRAAALKVAGKLLEAKLNEDKSDYHGQACQCSCGGTAVYRGRRAKTFVTVVGEITLERAYYYCHECGSGFYPRDRTLGLSSGLLSPGVEKMVGASAAMVSFEESHELLEELANIEVETKEIERTAETLGKDIAKDECSHVPVREPPRATMYLGLDGTGIPMRHEALEGRVGKQPDGTAKTREVKLVSVWTADTKDKEGNPVRDKGSVSYSAAIESAAYVEKDESPSDFALRVAREARRTGFENAHRQVIIGDGAKWIWALAYELFPHGIQIVDLYHALETVSTVAKKLFGVESKETEQKAQDWRELLEKGAIDEIIGELTVFEDQHPEATTCIRYLETNRERMRYPFFRSLGLCVSSGVEEAGCKVAIGTRLKRSGMHWTVEGANAIIALRCNRLSHRDEDYWARRNAA